MTYPNFKFSFKKSADFSCLFTFFQTIEKNWQLFITFWLFHMFWQKSNVWLNFHTNNKIDQKNLWTKILTNLTFLLHIPIEGVKPSTFGNIWINFTFQSLFINIFVHNFFGSILLLVWKFKQTSDFCQNMWNSQNVVKSCQFSFLIWKNVNKQLKSADFLCKQEESSVYIYFSCYAMN